MLINIVRLFSVGVGMANGIWGGGRGVGKFEERLEYYCGQGGLHSRGLFRVWRETGD